MGNKYIYQNVKVGRAGVSFKINGTAKSNSVPLSNENRTFGIALNIYYNNSSTPEFHYQNFSADTDSYQQVSLSVTPEKTNEVVNYIAFTFVYGYNENEMTVTNAELNILATGYVTKQSEDSKDDSSVSAGNDSDDTEVDNYVDYEVLSESVDKTKPYMQTSSEYDSTGNYVTSETNEQGSTTQYAYDANGNPLTYRDGMSMTWKNGRQLATFTNGDTSISYGYDSDSVRTTKTVNGVKYTYAYLNGQLLYETRGDAKFYYSYDANGILYNVRYTLTDGGTEYSYYYTHNSRGDIVGIYNGAGELKAHYEYDAWGNVISITDNNGNAITNPNHVGNLNPFRYRGYYQDTETGLYYLMSRYYDPITHRFINADGYFQSGTSILEANTFAYCGNNPTSFSDSTGTFFLESVVFGFGAGLICNVAGQLLSGVGFSNIDWGSAVISGLTGAVLGGIDLLGLGVMASSALKGGVSFWGSMVNSACHGDDFELSLGEAAVNGLVSVGFSIASGGNLSGSRYENTSISDAYNRSNTVNIASNIYDVGSSVVTTTKKPHPVPAPVPKPKQKECRGCGRPIGKGSDQCSSPSYY